jgi:hypothetical protein
LDLDASFGKKGCDERKTMFIRVFIDQYSDFIIGVLS